jgi:NAD(P)H-nitrite reductase large subunit
MSSEQDDVLVCRCNEVSLKEIKEAIKEGARTVKDVKRRTRAGMGLCQGRSCAKTVARIIATELNISIERVEMDTQRMPVRPVEIKNFLSEEENNE